MKALSQVEKNMLYDSYKLHGSLRAVSRFHCRSINTVKKYVSEYTGVKIQNIVKELATKDERLIGLYVGLWLGDGTQYFDRSYTIKICCHKENHILHHFIQDIIYKIFRKKTYLVQEKSKKSTLIKFHSKFIFNFIYDYVIIDGRIKTHSVRLKQKINTYSQEFIEGCLLGLILSDGYLKNTFHFNVTSKGLSDNMRDILHRLGFNSKIYIHNRKKWNWKNLNMLSISKKETEKLEEFINEILRKITYKYSFNELKYGPAQI